MYQGIFDTDFDKYTEDAVALFGATGVNTVFENLQDFPMDWKTNPEALSGTFATISVRAFWSTANILM